MEKISVIITTFNRGKYVKRAIESVLNQTYQNIEIIIVDDSENIEERMKILKVLEKYKEKIKVILNQKNMGGCYSRNIGIEYSQGKYVAFLDDDDYYLPDKITKQYKLLLEKKLDFVTCNMYKYNEKKLQITGSIIAKIGTFSEFSLRGVVYTSMLLVKKEVLMKIGMFTDTPKYQDHLLVSKLLVEGYIGDIVKEELVMYSIGSSGQLTLLSEKNFYKNLLALKKLYKLQDKNKDKFSEIELREMYLKRKREYICVLQAISKRNKQKELKYIYNYIKILNIRELKDNKLFLIKSFIKLILNRNIIKRLEILKLR